MTGKDIVKAMKLSLLCDLINNSNMSIQHINNKYIQIICGQLVLWFYEESHEIITDEEELNLLNMLYTKDESLDKYKEERIKELINLFLEEEQ